MLLVILQMARMSYNPKPAASRPSWLSGRLQVAYVNYFVLAAWHLIEEKLTVWIEREMVLDEILSMKLPIPPESRKK